MEFLKLVDSECEKQGIRLVLSPESWVYMLNNAARCRGFFDPEGTLAVATGCTAWAGVLAHEFGHLEQHREGLFPEREDDIDLEAWYAGKTFPLKKVALAIHHAMDCELDAECRAVGYISKYQLVSDMGEYIARANGYLVCHQWAFKHRRWPFGYIDWMSVPGVPSDRLWTLDEVLMTPEIEQKISEAQEKTLTPESKVLKSSSREKRKKKDGDAPVV